MLNVNRLRMLREVASRGTIAAAAEALFMTPSAVSQQMAVLEREAGAQLLERHGRGVRLTEIGVRLVGNTERILADIERAEADIAAASQGVVGPRARLGVPDRRPRVARPRARRAAEPLPEPARLDGRPWSRRSRCRR